MEVIMKSKVSSFLNARYVAYLGVLCALVIAFQMLSGFMQIGATRICLVLVPIVLGGMVLGITAGAILGAVFGLVVIIDALIGLDPFTLYLLGEQPVVTVLLCLLKGVAAGAIPAVAYKFIAKKNKYVAAFVASALAPICNTGIFAIGAFIILQPIIDYLTSVGLDVSGMSAGYIVFVIVITFNFFIEFAISLVLAPAVYTVNNVVEKKIAEKKKSAAQDGDNQGGDNLSGEAQNGDSQSDNAQSGENLSVSVEKAE